MGTKSILCLALILLAGLPAPGHNRAVLPGELLDETALHQAPGQDRPVLNAPPEPAQQIFDIKHADVLELAMVLKVFNVEIIPSEKMMVIAVRGPRELLAEVEAAIRRLDVPPAPRRDIELTGYILQASLEDLPGTTSRIEDPWLKVIQEKLPFKSFRVLDKMIGRTRELGNLRLEGSVLLNEASGAESVCSYELKIGGVLVEQHSTVQKINLEQVGFQVAAVPLGKNPVSRVDQFRLENNLSIADGRWVLVGKNYLVEAKTTLILVLSARIVDEPDGTAGRLARVTAPAAGKNEFSGLVSISVQNVPLEQVLKQLCQQLGLTLQAGAAGARLKKPISLTLQDAEAADIFRSIERTFDIRLQRDGKKMIVK